MSGYGPPIRGTPTASGYRSARSTSGTSSTVVQNGGAWAWPNSGEPFFIFVADVSWMVFGQTLFFDDGVHTGTITLTSIDAGLLLIGGDVLSGPAGGTAMLDGATVTLVP